MSAAITIRPLCSQWDELIARRPNGEWFDTSLDDWRIRTRGELGLETDRPIIATGHQTLLWHPGILSKYLVTDAYARAHNLALANLVVDQHVGEFGTFAIPIRKVDGGLSVRRIELCRPAPRKDVPMGRHQAFTPPRPPDKIDAALPSVEEGVRRTFQAVYAHRDAPNAALQMADALADLMSKWVPPIHTVTATDLISTSLAQAIMKEMISDPWRCAQCYNRAVQQVSEAGIGPLMIRDDYVELPLWRIREDGRRMHAYDSDVEKAVGDIANPKSKIDLLPRALFMTALVRLGMCDLFIHGTGGAVYDRAMEVWMKDWLGVEVGSIAVVTVDLRLPLRESVHAAPELSLAISDARRIWHDPMADRGSSRPSREKSQMLQEINALPRNSPQRKARFLAMHEQLQEWRSAMSEKVRAAQDHARNARQEIADAEIAQRRDWPFPLYPTEMIDALAEASRQAAQKPVYR